LLLPCRPALAPAFSPAIFEGGFLVLQPDEKVTGPGGFRPEVPPPKTQAFWDIVDANRAPEDAEIADVLDQLNNPDVVLLSQIIDRANADFACWLQDRRNRRAIPHRLEQCGYVPVRNRDAKDGLWLIRGARQVIYAKNSLSIRDQLAAVETLTQPAQHCYRCGSAKQDFAPPARAVLAGHVSVPWKRTSDTQEVVWV
jgi:hypothetical protein